MFRLFTPAGTGVTFAYGLTPFAIVCEGHAEAFSNQQRIQNAMIVEGGTSLTLQDAEQITTSDVKFPPTAYFAGEKLFGWSVVVDVFHGVTADVATRVRTFVLAVVPHLHTVQYTLSDTPGQGMDMVCRVLFEAQQEYFRWANETASGKAVVDPVDFSKILGLVTTSRVQSLCQLPSGWYSMASAPTQPGSHAPPPNSSSGNSGPATRGGTAPAFNAHADQGLMSRFRDSGHSTINSMMTGHSADIPKHNGQQVCLTWALKGECSQGCRRANQHARHSRTTIQAIHSMMDACGVAAAQP